MKDQREFEVRQIVIGHENLWHMLVAFADSQGMFLGRIPLGEGANEDDLPTYIFCPKETER